MKMKLLHCNLWFLLVTLHLKTEFRCSYFLALFTNFSVVTAILPIMPKLNVILRSECVNTLKFWQSLGKWLKAMMILPLKNVFYFAITCRILKIAPFSLQQQRL